MPLLVYPILSLVLRTFLLNTVDSLRPQNAAGFSFRVESSERSKDQLETTMIAVGSMYEAYRRQMDPLKLLNQNPVEGSLEHDPGTDSQEENGRRVNDSEPMPDQVMSPEDVLFEEHRWSFANTSEPEPDETESAVESDAESATDLDEVEIESLEQLVSSGQVDAGIRLYYSDNLAYQLARYELVYDPESPYSKRAADYLRRVFAEVNLRAMQVYLRSIKVPSRPMLQPETELRVESTKQDKGGGPVSLASLIPLILVLMTITGAVYPAIDLTAGERERGTLETLMAAPVPRMGILFAKFVAVLTVAVLTATLNIIGMVVTVWAFGLDDFFGNEAGLTPLMVIKIFGLLILFAAFFSAILLAVTSYARSFKEAQSYLIPVILLSMAPGLMAMTPGLSLDGPLCVTPMVNLLLLARDVLQQNAQVVPSLIVIASTLLCTGLAILVAARIFGTDAILYGSQGSWSDMFQRPRYERAFASTVLIALSLALLFPLNMVMIAVLGRSGDQIQLTLFLMGLFAFLSFVVVPWIIARHQRVKIVSGFGLDWPRFVFLAAALLLGLSLWPIVMSLISLWHDAYSLLAGAEQSGEWHDQLVAASEKQVRRFRMVSPASIALSLAVIPAICEEWFFRGFLLRGLLGHTNRNGHGQWKAIFLSAVLFGLFHTLSGSAVALDRLIPTTLIGIALGYLCYKSNSIVPGIVLHIIHNGFVAFLGYYQPQLSRLSWFPGEQDAIPYWWALVALVPALIGFAMIAGARTTPMDSKTDLYEGKKSERLVEDIE